LLTLTAALPASTLLAACTGGGSPGPTTPSSPALSSPAPTALSAAALQRGAAAAVRAGHSVHVVVTTSITGKNAAVTVRYDDDATATGGRQVITLTGPGSASAGHVTIVLIGQRAYVQGDALGLSGLFGLDPGVARETAGRWIGVQPGWKLGQNSYEDIADGITLGSVADEMSMSGTPTRTGASTVGQQLVVGIQGQGQASSGGGRAVLYLADNASLRPVEYKQQGGTADTQLSFSHWGEKVQLTAPANPVPATSITPVSSVD
jgi:hypothetical protein